MISMTTQDDAVRLKNTLGPIVTDIEWQDLAAIARDYTGWTVTTAADTIRMAKATWGKMFCAIVTGGWQKFPRWVFLLKPSAVGVIPRFGCRNVATDSVAQEAFGSMYMFQVMVLATPDSSRFPPRLAATVEEVWAKVAVPEVSYQESLLECGLQSDIFDKFEGRLIKWLLIQHMWFDVPGYFLWQEGWENGLDQLLGEMIRECSTTSLNNREIMAIGRRLLKRVGQGWRALGCVDLRDDAIRKGVQDRIECACTHPELLNSESRMQMYMDWESRVSEEVRYISFDHNLKLLGSMYGGGVIRPPNLGDSDSEADETNFAPDKFADVPVRRFFLRLFMKKERYINETLLFTTSRGGT
jgi:hypothetical protein